MKISHILFTEEQKCLVASNESGSQTYIIDGKHSIEDYLAKFKDPRKQTDIPVLFGQSAFIL